MRYLVVHAHLYQPPRENPWSEVIERQPSATPFHDWNERVSDECYERLGAAGVRGPRGRIVTLVNLFSRISFNLGPTLAAWLERRRPDVLADALAGDAASRRRSGTGAALMQAFGHPILPLCEPRERRLQLAWGRADFRRRFGREPAGTWLPECAVDLDTLETCADLGLRFTILAPEQVRRIRPLSGGEWQDVSGGRVPPHRPYLVRLPSGRDFTVFVFDGPLSRGVAFGGALSSGERLLGAFHDALSGMPGEDGVVLLAADGETFGHHQAGAEEHLAEALVRARLSGIARVTDLGEVLENLPPTHEAELVLPSSWSCPHGVGRWERACGCGAFSHPEGWTWDWREPLRHAVAHLRDRVFALVDRKGNELFPDPWNALEAWGDELVRPPSPARVEAFLDRHARENLPPEERRRARAMLELVRQVLFSATSCGWFFDDIAGIEAVQVLRHAARAVELARDVFGLDAAPDIVRILEQAPVNDPGYADGAEVWRRQVLPARRTPDEAVGLHATRRLDEAIEAEGDLSPSSARHGAFATDDMEPVAVDREEGLVRVRGRALVAHLRTGESRELAYVATWSGVDRPPRLEIDGRELACPCPILRERLLGLAALRAASRLPAPNREQVLAVAWLGREARALGAPLPSPFPEALRGGARALVRELLDRPPTSADTRLVRLRDALEAAEAAGLGPRDLEDLRPLLDRELAFLARWFLAGRKPLDADAFAGVLALACRLVGDRVLGRVRRWLVAGPEEIPREQLVRLAGAAGLARDALAPADIPVRVPGEADDFDDSVA